MIKVQSLAWLIAHPPPEVPSLWGHALLPQQGITVLHSASKVGKSMLLLNLALAGAAGWKEFLGMPLQSPFTSLIYQGEIHQRGMWERASVMIEVMRRGAGISEEALNNVYINETQDITLDDHAAFTEFRNVVRWMRPKLVGIDPFAHVLPIDENSNALVGAVMKNFRTMCVNPGSAVALIHHDGKPTEATLHRRPMQRTRGADVMTAAADSVLSLVPLGKRHGEGPRSRLEFDGRYGPSIEPLPIFLNERTLWFEIAQPGRGEPQGVVSVLQGMGGSDTVAQLAREVSTQWGYETERMRVARGLIKDALDANLLTVNGGTGDDRSLTITANRDTPQT